MSQALWRSLGFCQICAPIQQSTRINPQFHLDNSGVLWRRAINIANRYNSLRLWGVVRLACNAPKACINRLGASALWCMRLQKLGKTIGCNRIQAGRGGSQCVFSPAV